MVKEAEFTSVWDEDSCDCKKITTSCKVNMETKEVFDIVVVPCLDVDILNREYVTVDGTEYPVSPESERENNGFWYK